MSIESRLRRLELLIGEEAQNRDNIAATSSNGDFHVRLLSLETNYAAAVANTTEKESIATMSAAIDDLMQELSPGTALSYQKQIVAPLLYRQQMVLACEDQLRKDHSLLREILSLLSIDTMNNESNNKKACSEDTVINAPILLLERYNDEKTAHNDEKVEKWSEILNDLHVRSRNAGNRIDAIVSAHNLIIAGLSERLVEMSEQVKQITEDKATQK
jgi:hypothetical protein